MKESNPRKISIQDYHYDLPETRIASHPLEERDASRLLIYRGGKISEDIYRHLDQHIPPGAMMVFNNSRVIPARMIFTKESGASIEIFCLEPQAPFTDYAVALQQQDTITWKCMIGGLAKWKEPFLERNITVDNETISLKANLKKRETDAHQIRFTWTPGRLSFAEILSLAGDIPLPPYIKRETTEEDAERYQTVYAKEKGSVAAPTAGLHFTEDLLDRLSARGIPLEQVSLHVGAGTFKPVKSETIQGHEMHGEWIDVSLSFIEKLLGHESMVMVVGTTSLRTIESLYWMGVKAKSNPDIQHLIIEQWDAYDDQLNAMKCSKKEALESLMAWMKARQISRLFTQTQLLIAPGYTFRIAGSLVTNFHQPQSTLLLLVAAAIGDDWRKCYDYALQNDFRFLSYGDGSLLFFS